VGSVWDLLVYYILLASVPLLVCWLVYYLFIIVWVFHVCFGYVVIIPSKANREL